MAALVRAYRKSGLGLKQFAREHKISPGRLHYWVYHKQRNSRLTSSGPCRTSDRSAAFQEVKLGVGSTLMASWSAEVMLAGGLSIRFSRAASPEWIGEVIEALQRSC